VNGARDGVTYQKLVTRSQAPFSLSRYDVTLLGKVTSVDPPLHLIVNFHFGKPLDTDIVEQERRLVADKEIGRVTLAVESDSGESEGVYSVVTGNKNLPVTVVFFIC